MELAHHCICWCNCISTHTVHTADIYMFVLSVLFDLVILFLKTFRRCFDTTNNRNCKLEYSFTNVIIINTTVIQFIEEMKKLVWNILPGSYKWGVATAVDIMISGKPNHFHKKKGISGTVTIYWLRLEYQDLYKAVIDGGKTGDEAIYIFRINIKYLIVVLLNVNCWWYIYPPQ